MWRDLWAYALAWRRHFVGLVTGTFMAFVLILWDDVLHWGNIPAWIWVGAAVLGFFVSGFNAWREEHARVAAPRGAVESEMELRRPQFEMAIARLRPEQEEALRYLAQVGDSNATQLRDNLFPQQGKTGGAQDADSLLLGIAETGILEPKERGTAFPRYGIKPVWEKLVIEWAAPPTAVDKRIADKARALHRSLSASFEDWPAGLNKLDDLTGWAGKLLRCFGKTDAALNEIVDLRPEASHRIERTVGKARDAYFSTADVINPLFKLGGLSIDSDNRQAIEGQLRAAVGHMQRCLAALDTLSPK